MPEPAGPPASHRDHTLPPCEWVEESDKAYRKEERIAHLLTSASEADSADDWVLLLAHLLVTDRIDHVGVVVSEGDPRWSEVTEKIVHVGELEPKLLREVDYDTLYLFTG